MKHKQKGKILTQLSRERLEKTTLSKVCGVCRIEQPITNFSKAAKNKDGYSNRCKQCVINVGIETRRKKSTYLSKFKSVQQERPDYHSKRYNHSMIINLNEYCENKTGSGDAMTHEEWVSILKVQHWRCSVCGVEFTNSNPPTRDHIISICWGGSLAKDNVQALCGHCNSQKGTRCYAGLYMEKTS